MNKRGNAIFFLLMMGVVFFLLGLALAPALKDVASEAMSTPELNCSATDITDQDQATCTSIDVMQPIYTGIVFGLAGLLIAAIYAAR